ncbi:MAG: hypothetical protein ACREC6_02905 [Hyphomicrobiaceae bacterium]
MTTDRAIVIGGIPIPSDDPVFLAVLAVHVPAGLICTVAGIAAMLSRKRAGRHPTAGSIYYWSLSVVFATATALSVMRWTENYHLFILGVLALASASLGRMARRRRRPSWVRMHIVGMGMSYVLLLTAFYVDNGPNLPLWQELPQWAFWVLPVTIGAPIIIHALLRHPLVRPAQKPRSSALSKETGTRITS